MTLRRVREHTGFSQERLAVTARVARTYVGRVERDTLNPTMVTVDRLLTALGVSWAEFGVELDAALSAQSERTPRARP